MLEYLEIKDGPVVEGLEKHEIVLAKNQQEYRPLRALRANTRDGRVLTRWAFTEEQRKAIAEGADLYIQEMCFDNLFTPLLPFISDGLDAAYVTIDFKLSEAIGEHLPTQTTTNQATGTQVEIDPALLAGLLAGGFLEIVDKVMNGLPLTTEQQATFDRVKQGLEESTPEHPLNSGAGS